MAKYTAQEMRDYADAIAGDLADNDHGCVEYSFDDLIPVVEALRQAADAMEREECKKKYEYAVLWDYDDSLFVKSTDYSYIKQKMDEVNADGLIVCHIVRRSVGEWEEVVEE